MRVFHLTSQNFSLYWKSEAGERGREMYKSKISRTISGPYMPIVNSAYLLEEGRRIFETLKQTKNGKRYIVSAAYAVLESRGDNDLLLANIKEITEKTDIDQEKIRKINRYLLNLTLSQTKELNKEMGGKK